MPDGRRIDADRVQLLERRVLPVLKLGARRLLGRRSPFQMTLSLTNRCNFKCDYCDIPLQRRDELDTAEWCRMIDEFVAGGMGRASIIGGEPLLREDAGAILRHLASRGVHTAMNTNGWFVEERIDEIAGLDLACVTLDGPPEVHDAQRRRGSYARAVRAVELLVARGVRVVTMTVLTPAGAETLPHVLDVARGLGVDAFFQLEHDKTVDVMAPIAPRLRDEQIVAIARTLLAHKDAGAPVGNSRAILEQHVKAGRYLGTCDDCWAGQYYGYVLSDGTVAPCLLTQWQQETGNGRTHGYVRAFLEMAPPAGPGCSCVPTHQVNQVLDFRLDVLWDAFGLALGGKRSPRAGWGASKAPA
jgi:MoaA/NifB/PqqE/SkfB family radical SAM enzyme